MYCIVFTQYNANNMLQYKVATMPTIQYIGLWSGLTSSGVMCTANTHWTLYTKLHIIYALTSILRPSTLWGHTMHRTYWERHWWACQAVTRTRWGAEIHEDTSREVSQCDLWGHLSNCQEYICTVDNVSKTMNWKELVQSDKRNSASTKECIRLLASSQNWGLCVLICLFWTFLNLNRMLNWSHFNHEKQATKYQM